MLRAILAQANFHWTTHHKTSISGQLDWSCVTLAKGCDGGSQETVGCRSAVKRRGARHLSRHLGSNCPRTHTSDHRSFWFSIWIPHALGRLGSPEQLSRSAWSCSCPGDYYTADNAAGEPAGPCIILSGHRPIVIPSFWSWGHGLRRIGHSLFHIRLL
jgi:hypothetical protein